MPRPKTVLVVPSPDLTATQYVPGVPAVGLVMPIDEAQPMLDAGIVVIANEPDVPAPKPDVPAPDKEAK